MAGHRAAVASSGYAEQRNRDPCAVYVHSIGREGNEHLASIMEPPSKAEGFNIVSD
jgi:hypothetical protein